MQTVSEIALSDLQQQWDEGIRISLAEVAAGKVVPAEQVFARLEQKFDLESCSGLLSDFTTH